MLIGGILLGSLFLLLFFLLDVLLGVRLGVLGSTLSDMLIFGLIAVLISAQGTFIRHFALRKLLAHYDYLPWRLVPFLEYARERLLLRRVGGGYIFVHRTLQEYFASQDASFGQQDSQPS